MKKNPSVNYFVYRKAQAVDITDIDELIRKVREAIQMNDITGARPYAEKAAADHGATGLLLHAEYKLAYITEQEGQGEIFTQAGMETLVDLMRAKHIITSNQQEHDYAREHYSDQIDSVEFWEKRIQSIRTISRCQDPIDAILKIVADTQSTFEPRFQ